MIFKQNLDTTYLSIANVWNLGRQTASSGVPPPQSHWRFFREPLQKFSGQKYFTTLSESHKIQFCILPFSHIFPSKPWISTWAVHNCHHHLHIRRRHHGNSSLPQWGGWLSRQKKSSRSFSLNFVRLTTSSPMSPLIAQLMRDGQGKWTEQWLSFWAPRAVWAVVWTP